jgi:glycosyltransferase involved in cell wall biosynthesis
MSGVTAPTLSVVIPIYNEAETIAELHRRLVAVLDGMIDFEIVLVDDRSSDGSWDAMKAVAAADPRARLVRLSRNFGHQVAITAGLDTARGDAVVLMDGDLQDPPEVIPELVAKWREGHDIVYAVRAQRDGETAFKLLTARLFYWLLRRMAQVDIPENAGDFRLLSRRAAEAMRQMPERARFLRGMTSWIGYRQTGVEYRRDPRYAGETKYPLRKMLKFAVDAITSFSTVPLRVVSGLGLLMVVFCIGYLVYALVVRFATHNAVTGWTTVVVLVLLIGGIQMLSLGIVGQYIARIFEEAKNRPLYFIDELVEGEERVGVDEQALRTRV